MTFFPGNYHPTSWKERQTLIYAHNCGRPSNIHAYEVSKDNEIKDDDKCIPVSTGPSVASTVKEFTQRAIQYYKDHATVKTFPPSYYVQNENIKKVIETLENHSSLLGGKILVGYNPANHLRILGLDDRKIDGILGSLENIDHFDNTIVYVYPNHSLLFVYVVCENEHRLEKDLAKINAILKSLYHINHQTLQKKQFTIAGVLVLPDSKNSNGMSHPCLNVSAKDQDLIVCFDTSFGQWLDNFLDSIQNFGKFSSPTSNVIEVIAGGMMASMAHTKVYLPRISDNDTINVKTILLTEPQIACIRDRSNWKMIQAAYGSGKTIILNEIARNMLKNNSKDLIINITFDPQRVSLFQEIHHQQQQQKN